MVLWCVFYVQEHQKGSTSSVSGFKASQKTRPSSMALSVIRQTGRSPESNVRPVVYKGYVINSFYIRYFIDMRF